MQARGPLMIEHRLIEGMIAVIKRRLERAARTQSIDPYFVDSAVDFIRVYADRTHHGKEEDIMFRDLRRKDMSADHQRIMDELIQEHVFGRATTKALVEANARYRKGDASALLEVTANLKTLVGFYPKHIKKEDAVFFPAALTYVTEEEDQAMLAEFWEFDRKMIHEKYQAVVKGSCENEVQPIAHRTGGSPQGGFTGNRLPVSYGTVRQSHGKAGGKNGEICQVD